LQLGQHIEISPRASRSRNDAAQLYNSIAAIESQDQNPEDIVGDPISLSAILFENQEPPIRESSVLSPVDQMPSESPVQRREDIVFDNIIPYDMQADDQVDDIVN
jgi:hypothetical protein